MHDHDLRIIDVPRPDIGHAGSSLTMVLTAVAFKLQIADSLPKLSYPTLIDWYVLASFFFIFSVVVQNVLMGLAQNEQDEDRDKDIDAITGLSLPPRMCLTHSLYHHHDAWS